MDTFQATMLGLMLILPLGWCTRFAGKRIHLPAALSLMILGMLLGPEIADLIPEDYFSVSGTLSKMAFVILLVRAGLGLTPRMVKKYLIPTFYLGIIPLLIEGAVLAFVGKQYLFQTWPLAFLFASILMCESPAIIFPTMLKVRHKKLGSNKEIPNKIMVKTLGNILIAQTAILFFIDSIVLEPEQSNSLWFYYLFPINICLGVVLSFLLAKAIPWQKIAETNIPFKDESMAAILLTTAALSYFGLGQFKIENIVATVFIGIFAFQAIPQLKDNIDKSLFKVWSVFEIILFCNLGAHIRLDTILAGNSLITVLGILLLAHASRQLILYAMLKSSHYDNAESVYIGFAHIPKATMQAVFGALPLMAFENAGLTELIPAGEIILMAAVLGIILTAPPGALMLDNMAPKLLKQEGAAET